jgi:hypothetical protein
MDFVKLSSLIGSWSQFVTASCCLWAVVNVYACRHELQRTMGEIPSVPTYSQNRTYDPPEIPEMDFRLERIDPPEISPLDLRQNLGSDSDDATPPSSIRRRDDGFPGHRPGAGFPGHDQ